MFNNSNRGTTLVVLLVVVIFTTAISVMPTGGFQGVDAQGRNQPLICDDTDHVLTFPNYVTALTWLEQIRWKDTGSFTIGMEFDIKKNVALSYRC